MQRGLQVSLWRALERARAVLTAHLALARGRLKRQQAARRLRLSETLSLGEKRFLAVVQFQQQEFLVGGTGNSIALLAKLEPPDAPPDRVERPDPLADPPVLPGRPSKFDNYWKSGFPGLS